MVLDLDELFAVYGYSLAPQEFPLLCGLPHPIPSSSLCGACLEAALLHRTTPTNKHDRHLRNSRTKGQYCDEKDKIGCLAPSQFD